MVAGEVPPLVLIMPGVSSRDGLVNGAGTNLLHPDNGCDGVGTGRFEDYLVDDLIPHVEAHFHVGGPRGADGFSVGGFMAVKLALRHPCLFRSVGAYDGAFVYRRGEVHVGGLWPWRRDRFLNFPIFTPAFGLPRDLSYFSQHNPADLAASVEDSAVRKIRWLIQCGDARFDPQVNYARTQHLLGLLAAKGGENAFGDGQIPGARHNWHWADEHLRLALPLHAEVLWAGR